MGGNPDMTPVNPSWVGATITFNGEMWTNVGVRYKGNSTLTNTWRGGSDKLPLKLDFDQFEDKYPTYGRDLAWRRSSDRVGRGRPLVHYDHHNSAFWPVKLDQCICLQARLATTIYPAQSSAPDDNQTPDDHHTPSRDLELQHGAASEVRASLFAAA